MASVSSRVQFVHIMFLRPTLRTVGRLSECVRAVEPTFGAISLEPSPSCWIFSTETLLRPDPTLNKRFLTTQTIRSAQRDSGCSGIFEARYSRLSRPPHAARQLSKSSCGIHRRGYAKSKKSSKKAMNTMSPKTQVQRAPIVSSAIPQPHTPRPREKETPGHFPDDIDDLEWLQRLASVPIVAFRNLYIARKLILGFAIAFSWVFVIIKRDAIQAKYRTPNVKIKSDHIVPNHSAMMQFFTYRIQDWLSSAMFPINSLASKFAHEDFNHLWDCMKALSVILAALQPCISLRNIILSYTLGGFLADNICCMAVFFTDPNIRLSDAELDLKLLSIQQELQKPKEQRYSIGLEQEDWRNCCKAEQEIEKKLHRLKTQVTTLDAKELDSHNAKTSELQNQLQSLRARKKAIIEKGKSLHHTRRTLGASTSIFCLGEYTIVLLQLLPIAFADIRCYSYNRMLRHAAHLAKALCKSMVAVPHRPRLGW